MLKKQWQSILVQKEGYESIWRGWVFFVLLSLFCSLLFCVFSDWLCGFGLGLFSISAVLSVVLVSWLCVQYILCTLLEFLAVHPSSIASQI